MPQIIAITGGIGTGKSVVSHILRINGYEVYDCDSEAKRIMDNDTGIHASLNKHIHPDAVKDKVIDRRLISRIVFSNPDKLKKLNDITHTAVLDDIRHRIETEIMPKDILFIETAILYQSNLDTVVDQVWNVTAPSDIRVARVMKRNSCDCNEVIMRIQSQESYIPSRYHPRISTIVNDDISPVLPRIMELLKLL